MGKLNNISQLCPALKTLTSEATFMMRSHIGSLAYSDGRIDDKKGDSHIFHPTQESGMTC